MRINLSRYPGREHGLASISVQKKRAGQEFADAPFFGVTELAQTVVWPLPSPEYPGGFDPEKV